MSSISVIIPARNDADHLRACLAALAAQTRAVNEVVVVDNGSTDSTAEVARLAGAVVVAEPLRGIPAAAAAGFDAATGDVLARLDADSLAPPDWAARILAHLEDAQHPAVVTGPGEFYGAGRLIRWLGTRVYVPCYFWSMGLVLGHPPVFGSNFAMHAEVWATVRDRVHRTVRTVHDDLDLSLQLSPGVDIRYDGELRVGISARPLQTISGFSRRAWWVYRTLRVNGREHSLVRRRDGWRSRHSSPTGSYR